MHATQCVQFTIDTSSVIWSKGKKREEVVVNNDKRCLHKEREKSHKTFHLSHSNRL